MKNDTSIKKTIKSLQLSDNSVVKKDDEILKEAKSCYQKLEYTSTVAPKNDLYDDLFFPFLPRLIDNDQTGFLKNRFIGENIRLVDSVINYANIKKFQVCYFLLTSRRLLIV